MELGQEDAQMPCSLDHLLDKQTLPLEVWLEASFRYFAVRVMDMFNFAYLTKYQY